MNTPTNEPKRVALATSSGINNIGLDFKIGDRTYWVGRARDGHAFTIVANGDLVDHASTLHYGDVGAFAKIAQRLIEIQKQWEEIS